jgi:CBS domain-containing protein
MKAELVKNWMTADPISISPQTTLPEAHQIMRSEKIRRLPVVDENDILVGMVTLGDVRGAEASSATSLSIWELNYLLAKLKVSEVMTRKLVTVTPETTLGQTAALMLEKKVSGLPVVEANNRLVGIITESDIFRMVVRHEWQTLQDAQAVPVP